MSIIAMEKAHDLSLDDRNFEARQVLVDAIAEAKKLEQAQKQEPVGFDKTVLDEWTKEYKVEVAYWKAKHDELLRILKQNAEPWVQEPVGVVTGCAEHGEFFTAVFRSKTEVLVDTKIYTTPPQRPTAEGEDIRKPLTDEQMVKILEAAGVKFQRFMGGIAGTKECWVTSGSQDVAKLCNGIRSIIAHGITASEAEDSAKGDA